MLAPVLSLVLAQLSAPAPTTLLQPKGPLALEHGVLSAPLSGDLPSAAQRWALSRRAALGLPATSTLSQDRAFSTRFGGSVHLAQRALGLEVYGGGVVVTVDTQRRVVRLAYSVKPYARERLAFARSGAEALAAAAREVNGALLQPGGAPWGGWRRVAFVVSGELRAGYVVTVPTLKSSEAWYAGVDATDGQVLWLEDEARHASAAKVYASSPGGLAAGVGVTPLVDVTLPHLSNPDGGFLTGDVLEAVNCCPTADCDADAGAPQRRATGTMQTFGGTVSYDVAICDRRQRATNDPALRASGDYVYAPVDPPTTPAPSNTSPADFDEFAEVNAYWHVNKAYDYLRALSETPVFPDAGLSAFRLRDSLTGKRPRVWVNASDPDFQSATQNPQGVYVSNALSRTSNAAFVPREQMDALSLPELQFDTDALLIYQGDAADFAYDGPVLWHEFGHGAVYSTSNWRTLVTLDARSANNESSALHEGVADLVAAMTGRDPIIGTYVGPRVDPGTSAIRSVNNTFKCPDVLWGESHQDSQHFSGAVWQARSQFLGSDDGRTFDAAFFAAVVSFPADVNFEKAAAIIAHSVKLAFPGVADAEARLQAAFAARGVTGCSKVLDVTDDRTPRAYYNIPGTSFAAVASGSAVPGPYQLKLRVPNGARSVTVGGPYFVFGGGTVRLQVLAKANAPITFTRAGTSLTNDADVAVTPTVPQQNFMEGKAVIDVPCGGELYFTVANTSTRDRAVQGLEFSYEPKDSCAPVVPDAGAVDAGVPDPVVLTAAGDGLGPALTGCGCNAVSPFGLGLLLLPLALRRRRR